MWMCNVLLPRWLAQRISIFITHQVIGPGRPDRNKLIAYKLISQSEFGLPDQDPVLADCGSSSYQADLAAVTTARAYLIGALVDIRSASQDTCCYGRSGCRGGLGWAYGGTILDLSIASSLRQQIRLFGLLFRSSLPLLPCLSSFVILHELSSIFQLFYTVPIVPLWPVTFPPDEILSLRLALSFCCSSAYQCFDLVALFVFCITLDVDGPRMIGPESIVRILLLTRRGF